MSGDGAASAVSTLAPHRVVLDAGWALARTSAGRITTPEALDAAAVTWHPAVVPGTVAAAFPSADPYAWTGEHTLDRDDWWYRCTFAGPEPRGDAPWTLTLAGLATIADVWLNDAPLLHSENMFVSHDVDVTAGLRQENTLLVRFAALDAALGVKRPRGRWRTKLVEQQQLRWFRTTLLGRIPGWSASPQPVGPWRPVTLSSRARQAPRAATAVPALDGDDGVMTITLAWDPGDTPPGGRARITATRVPLPGEETPSPAAVTEAPLDVDERRPIVRATLRIPHVERWWPHTHGRPTRYRITAAFDGADPGAVVELGVVGFRTVALDTAHGAFTLCVNGHPIFCRGACWSPVDPVTLDGTDAQYRDALTLARDAGMNMLRVGGTMTYECDTFHALCDELGILVWQEFMFANMDYPGDAAFLATARDEATQLVQRLRHRPSLALFCGNNEVEQQAAMLGLPRETWRTTPLGAVLQEVCTTHAPDIPYWPSTPGCGSETGALPFHADSGDTHYFGYGPYLRPFGDVRASGVRFASETLAFANVPEPDTVDGLPCGAQGAGHHPLWKAGVPRDNGAGWDFEDVRDHYVRALFRVDPVQLRYGDAERYLALGRIASGEAMARAIAEWRRPTSCCRGALIWLYRDLRPGAGWGLIDVHGRPKAAYYHVRRVSRPTVLVLSDEGLNGLHLHAVHDGGTALAARLELTLYQGDVRKDSASTDVTIPARGAVTLRAEALLQHFADVTYAYRFGPPNHDLVVATLTPHGDDEPLCHAFYFPLGLPASQTHDPGLAASAAPCGDGSYALHLSTRGFAQSVAIQLRGHRPADNYFHMAPASSRTILLSPSGAPAPLGGTVTPLNGRGSVRIAVR